MKTVGYCFENTTKSEKELIKSFCGKNDYVLDKIYTDKSLLLKSNAECVIFTGFTDEKEDLILIEKLKLNRTKCIYLTNEFDFADAETIIGAYVYARQRKNRTLSENIRKTKEKNARLGRVPNLVFGYDKDYDDMFSMQINTEEAITVKRIFGLYTKEKIGVGKIAEMLNEDNIKTKRGCLWTANSIARILKNEIYTGKVTNAKYRIENGKRIKNEASRYITEYNENLCIIDEKMFDAAKRVMHENKSNFENKREKGIFSELIVCSECSSTFRSLRRKNKNVSWVCRGRNAKGAKYCSNSISISEDDLKSALAEYFVYLYENKNKLRDFFENETKKSVSRSEFETILSDGLEKIKEIANGGENFSDAVSYMVAYPDGAVDIYLKSALELGIEKTIDI